MTIKAKHQTKEMICHPWSHHNMINGCDESIPQNIIKETRNLLITKLFIGRGYHYSKGYNGAITNNSVDWSFSWYEGLLTESGCQFTSHATNIIGRGMHWMMPIYKPRLNPVEWQNQELKSILWIWWTRNIEPAYFNQHLLQLLFTRCQSVSWFSGYSPFGLFNGWKFCSYY